MTDDPGCGHVFEADGSTFGDPLTATFRCTRCGQERTQAASPRIVAMRREDDADAADLHRASKDLYETLKARDGHGRYRLEGYELMKAVGRWAERWPGDARIVPCDDGDFMSSSILLVEHRTARTYMGTTVVVIPQSSGPPCEIFLDPSDRNALIEALKDIRDGARPAQRAERRRIKDERSVWAAETYVGPEDGQTGRTP